MSTPARQIDADGLRDVSLRLTRRLRKHAHTDMTMSQLSAMSLLARHGSTRIGDLARREGVGKSTVTRMLGRLERLGYVSRSPDPEDRRGFFVTLTLSGHAVVRTANRRANAFLVAAMASLTEADQAAIMGALPALQRLTSLKP